MTVPETWASRELPILLAAYRRWEAGERHSIGQLEELRQELGITVAELVAGLHALADADPPYIDVETAGGWSGDRAGGGFITGISERTRRELGAWPSADGVLAQLVAALGEQAGREQEPERRGRLETAAEVLAGMARDVAVNVISAQIGRTS